MGESMTIKELADAAIDELDTLRRENPGASAREFSLAITALEDAQMRATRGLALLQGRFARTDLQR